MQTNIENTCLKTDSYKITHWNQYPHETEFVYSYFEARKGALFNTMGLFGLQYILKRHFEGVVVTQDMLDEANELCKAHFGRELLNKNGWQYIIDNYGGKLPLCIKAAPEGLPVPINNVLMTVENTDDKCYWLTNWAETILSQIWYPSTVAALSRHVKLMLGDYLDKTACHRTFIDFMLHDFGYRGVSSFESAGIGGLAHLTNFKGTDTLAAMQFARKYYNADLATLAYSVAATEHSIMTARGKGGERKVVETLLDNHPTGILSVVADSYDIYNFVDVIVGKTFKDRILERDGIFVVRPDSITPVHQTPEEEMVWILESLWKNFGGTMNQKGYKVINPQVRALWGDGIDYDGIKNILQAVAKAGFSVENIACFGMGGGLLQKINRDTQRCAFKSSAQCRGGMWHDIFKQPKDASKASKRGKLKLIKDSNGYKTVGIGADGEDILEKVFENGKILKTYTFDEVRKNAAI